MIKVTTLAKERNYANSYLLEGENSALIIDPVYDYQTVQKMTDLKIIAVLITHGHYDHIRRLHTYSENVEKIYGSVNIIPKLKSDTKNCAILFFASTNFDNVLVETVKEGKVTIGEFDVQVIVAPGHTDCSLMYIIDDMLFSGDVIFKDNIGRYDLPTGSFTEMKKTLLKIRELDNNLTLYPGHGDATTMLECKKKNRYLLGE